MMNIDQYNAMKEKISEDSGTMKGGGKMEADDVKIAKRHDAYVRQQNMEKIREDKDWSDLGARLKPILSSYSEENKEILSQFPANSQLQVQTILNIVTKLPRVAILDKKIAVDGRPMGNVVDIVKDIMENGIRNVEGVIETLRGMKRLKWHDEREGQYSDDEEMEESFMSTGDFAPKEEMSASKLSTPKYTPINTRYTRARSRGRARAPSRSQAEEGSMQKTMQKVIDKSMDKSMDKSLNKSSSKKKKKKNMKGNGLKQGKWEAY